MGLIGRLPDCDGQAADAESAKTQIKLEDAPRLLKIPKSECQMFGYFFHDTNGQNHGEKNIEDPWYFLKDIDLVTHWLDC